MKVIVYTSQLTESLRDESESLDVLAAILGKSRTNNRKRDITGVMLFRNQRFLQVLEGPDSEVDETYAKIAADERHCDLKVLFDEPTQTRHFPDWSMSAFATAPENAFTEENILAVRDLYQKHFLYHGETYLNLLRSTLEDAELVSEIVTEQV